MRHLLMWTMLTFLVMPLVSTVATQTIRTNWESFRLEVTHRNLGGELSPVSARGVNTVTAEQHWR